MFVCVCLIKFVNTSRRKGSVEGKFSPWMKTCSLRKFILWWTELHGNQRLLFKLDCLYLKEITMVCMLLFFFPIFIYYGYLVCVFIWLSDERVFLISLLKLPNLLPKTPDLCYNILYSKPEPLWLLVFWLNALS